MSDLSVLPTFPVRPEISDRMRRVQSENTHPEKAFTERLRRIGLAFETHRRDLPGKPDFVFPYARLVVFVDGDLWHGNQWKLRGFGSLDDQFENVNNKSYWRSKLSKNIDRDFSNTAALLQNGWRVLRFWSFDWEQQTADCR